jgi:uncharacterized protein
MSNPEAVRKSLPIVEPAPLAPGGHEPQVVQRKLEELRRLLATCVRQGTLVAFSGGVDSAFLLWAAEGVRREVGGSLLALTTVSDSMPSVDRADALRFSASLGIQHLWREGSEVQLPEYARNDWNRCYYCKDELFRIAGEVARERGLRWILYGYNASDHHDIRPGHRAAQEHGVQAPLSDAGLTKADIRFLMSKAGLEMSDKPASPCLSSRLMTGIPITSQRLEDVGELESILRGAGVSIFRVRICGEEGNLYLRIEVDPREMAAVLSCREDLVREGEARGYRWVTLDLAGYRTGGGVL